MQGQDKWPRHDVSTAASGVHDRLKTVVVQETGQPLRPAGHTKLPEYHCRGTPGMQLVTEPRKK